MKYFKQSTINQKVFTVRSLESQDVDAIVNYWVNGNKKIFEDMGIDLSRFPTKVEREKFFHQLVNNDPKKGESHLIVGVVDNEVFGYALFNHIHPGQDCQGHLHIISPHLRRQGITSTLMIDHIKAVVDLLNVKKIFLEPSSQNPGINRLLQKCYIFPKNTYLKPAVGICREMEVNRYVVSKKAIALIVTLFKIRNSLKGAITPMVSQLHIKLFVRK